MDLYADRVQPSGGEIYRSLRKVAGQLVRPLLRAWSRATEPLRKIVRSRLYAGNRIRCTVCEGTFRAWIGQQAYGSCPGCGSWPRHRFLWTVLRSEWSHRPSRLFTRILHVAPEPFLSARIRKKIRPLQYISLDQSAPNADVHADLEHTGLPDEQFDIVIICHVLEHILDDRAAMRELFRVLRKGGVAYVQVPCNQLVYETDEDPSVTDPAERHRRWGQFDHVRHYGRDLVDRLSGAGFLVREVRPADVLDSGALESAGLWNDILFRCERPVPDRESPANVRGA